MRRSGRQAVVLVCLSWLWIPPAAALERQAKQIGAAFELLPAGKIEFEAPGFSQSADTALAFGVAPFIDLDVAPAFSIGLTPRALFRVRGKDGTKSATEIDLRARAMLHGRVARAVRIFAEVEPGYSVLFIPDWPTDEVGRPRGFVLAFGAGLAFDAGPATFFSLEVNYQLGFQGVSEMGQHADVKTSFLALGFGIGARF